MSESDEDIVAFRDSLAKLHGEDAKEAAPTEKPLRYDKAAMLRKLAEVRCSWPWVERLDTSTTADVEQSVPEPDDDLNRELAFFRHAIKAVAQAHQKLDANKIPYIRPDDYYAEMLKTDEHMEKVRRCRSRSSRAHLVYAVMFCLRVVADRRWLAAAHAFRSSASLFLSSRR